MKKNTFTLVLVLIIGLITGIIVGEWLESINGPTFLTRSVDITWQPKGDFQVIQYDILLRIKLNLCSILGLVGSFLIYRKL
ncbi:DUF4321 domain-containing protein [Paenibacillus larvae]|nr:DUF4321 domain-containing protein [Paenibacillus larvae]ARF67428.1 hypothetical protein B7C51_05715 [Paenibacillus larvae subsp. pulvifaciens]AVG13174.1 hypothetical protein ERICII_02828 [Paenibacillus larvae subsp. larvae DSM 25430]MDR5568833.1 DUF4321 domain-containing protein [Paenibacillus larvae]MDR5596892.1 DUF4321 domain-containing protein [Paenibacillus larvae]QHZ52934.1 hypothetical protein ERICV_03839 [Paenibacillus larvae subsp. larvae]